MGRILGQQLQDTEQLNNETPLDGIVVLYKFYTDLYDILFKSFQFYVNKKASVIGGFSIYKTYALYSVGPPGFEPGTYAL